VADFIRRRDPLKRDQQDAYAAEELRKSPPANLKEISAERLTSLREVFTDEEIMYTLEYDVGGEG